MSANVFASHIRVQADWQIDVLSSSASPPVEAEVEEELSFWVSGHCVGEEKALYGRVHVSTDGRNGVMRCSLDGITANYRIDKPNMCPFKAWLLTKRSMRVSCGSRHTVTSVMFAPQREMRRLHGTPAVRGSTIPVFALAVSPSEIQAPQMSESDRAKYRHKIQKDATARKFAGHADYGNVNDDSDAYFATWRPCMSGSTDGSLRCFKAEFGPVVRECDGHVGDVNAIKFLPSAQIALSGGSDSTLKLWLLDLRATPTTNDKPYLAKCVVTLMGHHKAGISGVDFIDRGRHVVSSSRDGTVRIWDVSKPEHPISTLRFTQPTPTNPIWVNDVALYGETAVLAACEDGFVRVFDTRTTHSGVVLSTCVNPPPPSAVSAATYRGVNCLSKHVQNRHVFATGCQSGVIELLDMRKSLRALHCLRRSRAAVHDVSFSLHDGNASKLWAVTAEGDCCLWDATSGAIVAELTGADLDPLYTLQQFQRDSEHGVEHVLTGGYDGVVRHYTVDHRHMTEMTQCD